MFLSKFQKIIQSNHTTYTKIYNKALPSICDVSMHNIHSGQNDFVAKLKPIFRILQSQSPHSIEIGHIEDQNTYILHTYASNILKNNPGFSTKNLFVGVNSIQSLQSAIQYECKQLSFYTSVSPKYNMYQTGKTMYETKHLLEKSMEILQKQSNYNEYTKKLYISCIDYCPLTGKIDNDYIVKEILEYNKNYDIDEICLSDNIGIIKVTDLKYIIKTLPIFGLPLSKISLQLYVSPSNNDYIEDCIRVGIRNGITKYNVSYAYDNKLQHPITYDKFYEILFKHLEACN